MGPVDLTPVNNGDGGRGIAGADAAEQKRVNPIKRQQMEERRRELEETIARLEAEVAEYENSQLTFVSAGESARLARLLEIRREELRSALAEWETIAIALS